MAVLVSVMTSQGPPPSTHSVLPSLTKIRLEGPHGYLDDLVSRIDAPPFNSGDIHFYDEPTFGAPQLPNFIHRTERFRSLGLVVFTSAMKALSSTSTHHSVPNLLIFL